MTTRKGTHQPARPSTLIVEVGEDDAPSGATLEYRRIRASLEREGRLKLQQECRPVLKIVSKDGRELVSVETDS